MDSDYNVRIVFVDFVHAYFRAEVQVRLCQAHWSTILCVGYGEDESKIKRSIENEFLKLKHRAANDDAMRVDPNVATYEIGVSWNEWRNGNS